LFEVKSRCVDVSLDRDKLLNISFPKHRFCNSLFTSFVHEGPHF
jgi:hypothetical protein